MEREGFWSFLSAVGSVKMPQPSLTAGLEVRATAMDPCKPVPTLAALPTDRTDRETLASWCRPPFHDAFTIITRNPASADSRRRHEVTREHSTRPCEPPAKRWLRISSSARDSRLQARALLSGAHRGDVSPPSSPRRRRKEVAK